ncbi:MAG: hypothetical protein N2110_06920 [Flavobacteriales bacterium]|nr:hypothetical protein [Flavobacteriales bacterium]MCX7768734.1 hypothetical protein [Flavobacteriales bacterium]MDW8409894.1 hypothetical protein [Flavobacteriales bacterium]
MQPSPLEFFNDSVRVTLRVQYPARVIPPRAEVIVTPYLETNQGSRNLKPLALRGPKASSKMGAVLKPEGGEVLYTDALPYEPALERVKLKVKVSASKLGKTKKNLVPEETLAFGTITTPLMARPTISYIVGADKLGPVQKIHSTTIYFPFNSAEIRPSELEGPDLEGFKGFVERYAREGATFKNMEIVGYASPEGPEAFNQILSEARANSLEKIVLPELKRIAPAGVSSPKPVQLQKKGKGRDLEGFHKKLTEKTLLEKDKIKNLVESGVNRIVLREKLSAISPVLDQELETQLLAPLRRAEVLTTVELKPRSHEELKQLATFNPAGLTLEEGLFTSNQLLTDLSQRLKVLEALQEKFPDDWRPYNNAGVFLAQKGTLDQAEEFFRKAEKLAPREKTVLTNLGMIFLAKGEQELGVEYLKKSETPAAADALIPYLLRKGKYSEAVRMGSDVTSFNTALAQLLNGNPGGCLNIIEYLPDKSAHHNLYLKTIALARLGKEEEFWKSFQNLLNSTPASERDLLITNPEFLRYQEKINNLFSKK